MAKFPHIQQPCPLSAGEQAGIEGHCHHCDKHVYDLHGMSDAEKMALVASQPTGLCVSYRLPRKQAMALGLGAALAVSVTVPSHATDLPKTHIDRPVLQTQQQESADQTCDENKAASKTHETSEDRVMGGIRMPPAPPASHSNEINELTEPPLMLGGVYDPTAVTWIDSEDTPTLPSIRAEDAGEL